MKASIICAILLFLLIAGHLCVNILWRSRNTAPDTWDEASYLAISERLYGEYRRSDANGFAHIFFDYDRNRAPLVPALYVPFYAVFGNTRLSASLVNNAAVVVLCLSLYGIGRRLAGPWCGVAAAWITMTFPMLFNLSRQFFVEFPLTAAAAAVVYLCIASDGLSRLPACILLGVTLGAGMLVKTTFPLFAAGPVLATLIVGARYSERKNVSVRAVLLLTNFAVMLAFAALIAVPWLAHNLGFWPKYMMEHVGGYLGKMYGMSIPEYLLVLATQTFLPQHLCIAAALFFLWLLFRRHGRDAGALPGGERRRFRISLFTVAAWLALPLLAGICVQDKDARLISPMLPAAGLLLAYLYVRLTPPRTAAVTAALLLFLAAPFYGTSFLARPDSTQLDKTFENVPLQATNLSQYLLLGLAGSAPLRDDWKSEEVIAAIEAAVPERFEKDGRIAVVMVLTNHPRFHSNWFLYLYWRRVVDRGKRGMVVDYGGMPYRSRDVSPEMCAKELLRAHLVLVKDAGFQGPAEWFDELLYAVRQSGLFEAVDCNISLPDGSRALIFRQKGALETGTEKEHEEIMRLREKFYMMLAGGAKRPNP